MAKWTFITCDGVRYAVPGDANTYEDACALAATAWGFASTQDFLDRFGIYLNRNLCFGSETD